MKRRNQRRGTLKAKVLTGLFAAFASSATLAAAPVADTRITNIAEVEFTNTEDGKRYRLKSNPVTSRVKRIEGIDLEAPHTVSAAPNSVVSFAHTLTNTGNDPDGQKYTLSVRNLGGDQCDVEDMSVWIDVDGNGQATNPPDTQVIATGDYPAGAPGTSAQLHLPYQGALNLVVVGTVSGTVDIGDQCNIELKADTPGEGESAPDSDMNVDTVSVVDGPAVTVVKSTSTLMPSPGETVEFTITASNAYGSASAPRFTVDIEGPGGVEQKECFIIRDEIPLNTQFNSIVTAPGTNYVLLWHEYDDQRHRYHDFEQTPPADPADVDAVALCHEDELAIGRSYDFVFDVTVNANAVGELRNTAIAYTEDNDGIRSNPVVMTVINPTSGGTPTITNHSTNTYNDPDAVIDVADSLYIEVVAAACNLTSGVDTYPVTVNAALSGDSELLDGTNNSPGGQPLIATETGPNTGIFQVPELPTANAADPATPVNNNNGRLEVLDQDVLTIEINDACTGGAINTIVDVNPFGYLFDSVTGDPIPGATIQLLDNLGNPFGAAVVTDTQGRFFFTGIPDGTYSVAVTTPAGYTFASAITPGALANIDDGSAGGIAPDILAPNPAIAAGGSYGAQFVVDSTGAAAGSVRVISFDIPVDQAAIDGLAVRKTSSNPNAEIGDTITYTVDIANNTGAFLNDVVVQDIIPFGFIYREGSARLDGAVIADPVLTNGTQVFTVGHMPDGSSRTLTYRLRVGPASLLGDGINRARAETTTGLNVISNTASARVKIAPSVFSDEGYIIGKVYIDCDYDREQGHEEIGVPGVRIFMEDGTAVITDAEGKYSFYGVKPGTHVLKLDRTTLPVEWEERTLDNRHGGVGTSRFVDLKKGELHKADFAHHSCASGEVEVYRHSRAQDLRDPNKARENMDLVRAQVKWRRDNDAVAVGELEKAVTRELRVEGFREYKDPTRRKASGYLEGEKAGKFLDIRKRRLLNAGNSSLPGNVAPSAPKLPLKVLLKDESVNNELDFMDYKNGDTLPRDKANVRLKGPMEAQLKIRLNGTELPDSKVGEVAVLESRKIKGKEYVSVRFEPGENEIEVYAIDQHGNERGTKKIKLMVPARAADIRIALPAEPVADGVTPIPVEVSLVDENDVLVTARTPITLEGQDVRWLPEDLDPLTPGVQVFIEGGKSHYHFLPPSEVKRIPVRVSSGVLEAHHEIHLVPNLRPMLAVGVIEGTLSLTKLANNIVAAKKTDGFENELTQLSHEEIDGDKRINAGARAAFFLKGKVLGRYLLTASFDSEKEDTRLQRDIQPDQFYPVYGDSSVREYHAQSTSKLYVKLERGKSYFLWGDFTTENRGSFLGVADYNRSLNGASLNIEGENSHITIWGSHDSAGQKLDEISGGGISGPYRTSTFGVNVLENSERVQIIVRDRNQPGLVLSETELTRFSDYTFNPFSGELFFREPVPSVDSNFNPVFIRVTYEVETGGDKYIVAGANANVALSESINVGAQVAVDENPAEKIQIAGGSFSAKLSRRTEFAVEGAHASSDDGVVKKDGVAARAEIRHQGDSWDARVWYGKADVDYANKNGSISPGREELGAKASWRITDGTRLRAEALETTDLNTENNRRGFAAAIEQRIGDSVSIELGGRVSTEDQSPSSTQAGTSSSTAPIDVQSAFVKLSTDIPYVDGAKASVEYEQDLRDTEAKLLALGLEYYIADRAKLYVRHEAISSLDNGFGLNEADRQNNTVAGVELDYMRGGQVFSEYRVRDAFAGRETQASLGLRNKFQLSDTLGATFSFENIRQLTGNESDTLAVTAGLQYLDEDWKGSITGEFRRTDTTQSARSTLGIGKALSQNWTLLAKNTFDLSEDRMTGQTNTRDRFQIGAAYRDVDRNRFNALLKYELLYEDDEATSASSIAHVLSTHMNYKLNEATTLSGRLGAKIVSDEDGVTKDSYGTQLAMARLTYDFTEKWDIGVTTSALFSDDATYYGAGLEVGYLLHSNLWLSLGYNYFGYEEDVLNGNEYTAPGAFFRIRYKFDEDIFSGGDPRVNNTLTPQGE